MENFEWGCYSKRFGAQILLKCTDHGCNYYKQSLLRNHHDQEDEIE